MQGLSSDGDVLPAPQLTGEGATDPLGSLEQALLLARALQVVKVRVGVFTPRAEVAKWRVACQRVPEVV